MVNSEKIFLLKDLLDMNYNLIAQVILFCSTVGLGQMIFRKMPILSGLSEAIETKEEEKLLVKLGKEVKEKNPLKDVQYEDLLQGILRRVRILFLKTDDKIFGWTQRLKENSQKKKIREDGDYWDRIKKSTDK